MAKYYYTAQTPDGPVSGLQDATSKKLILKELSNKGYSITEIKRAQKFGKKAFWNFIESLHALIDQNTTLSEALALLAAQNNRTIRKIADQLNGALSEGTDFLDALETVFYDLDLAIVSLLRVGYENAGLEKSLSQIIIAKSQKDELVRETQKAIAYPAFVLVISLFVLIIIFDNVLPAMNGTRQSLGEILKNAKNACINCTENSRKFTLFGDPSMKLKYPEHHIVTNTINTKPAIQKDTIQALEEVKG